MTCETCGCAVGMVESNDFSNGRFSEEYECAKGHKGFIHGDESDQPKNWDRFGSVFE